MEAWKVYAGAGARYTPHYDCVGGDNGRKITCVLQGHLELGFSNWLAMQKWTAWTELERH